LSDAARPIVAGEARASAVEPMTKCLREIVILCLLLMINKRH
jgi:hypothetical protein